MTLNDLERPNDLILCYFIEFVVVKQLWSPSRFQNLLW